MRILVLQDKKYESDEQREEEKFHDLFMDESVRFVVEVLKKRHEVACLEADTALKEKLKEERPDLVFNLANGEGLPGGITFVPNVLEELGIPYTGSSGAAHGKAYDKRLTMKVLRSMGILVPKFKEIETLKDLSSFDLPFPILIKPKDSGYSRGIYNDNLVFGLEDLAAQVQALLQEGYAPLLLTEYIEGREFTLGVLGSGEHLDVLPPMEVSFKNLPEDLYPFYSFEAKVTFEDQVENKVPAKILESLHEKLQVSARHIFRTLGLSDYARLDVRVREDKVYLLEVNSLPGLHKTHSDLVKMMEAAGKSYDDLIYHIVDSAKERYKRGVDGRLISGK